MSTYGIGNLEKGEVETFRALLAKLESSVGGKVIVPREGGAELCEGRFEEGVKELVDGGSAGASSAVSSWSDMMDEEDASAGVERPSVTGVPLVSPAVRTAVTFGGFGEQVDVPSADSDGGLMKQYVRTDAAGSVRRLLQSLGIKMPKPSAYMLAMCTHTAATMPSFFRSGKDRLKTLAVLGDAALVAALASDAISRGGSCESMQSVRTTALTDAFMSRAFARSQFARYVNIAAGVSFTHSKTGATALEALVGLVAFYRTPSDVQVLARYFGLYK